MQEPSLQVKSIEGHGAKSTGAPPAKTDTAWYSWSTTAVSSSSFVPSFSARTDNVEARAEVVMVGFTRDSHMYLYMYIFECKYTYVHKARERIHHVETRRTCGEKHI